MGDGGGTRSKEDITEERAAKTNRSANVSLKGIGNENDIGRRVAWELGKRGRKRQKGEEESKVGGRGKRVSRATQDKACVQGVRGHFLSLNPRFPKMEIPS